MTFPTTAYNNDLIEKFRANGGTSPNDSPLLLLTTIGAKSGQPRVIPLVYTRDGERYVIIASKAGAPTNPDWFHNVVAHPEVTIEVGPDRLRARATVAQAAERDRLYQAQATLMPGFAEYERKTTRRIPVVVLEPIAT
jgi:deazaflavin-dependent oxidoreductase (nitroreductase family)